MTTLRLTPAASRFARRGRPWFFADDLAPHDARHGAIVRVVDERDRDLGVGVFSSSSKLALRLCGAWPGDGVPSPEDFFGTRLGAAIARRAGADGAAGVRLVHGDADGVPGLVVDRYADCVVLQVGAAAIECHLAAIVHELDRRVEPRMILARNDLSVRRLEGLEQVVELLHGRRVEQVDIVEDGLRFGVLPFTGHKTGFYLDQRPARSAVRGAAARARRVLDLFCYQGGFALNALRGGAQHVVAVDQSRDALERARLDAERNGLSGLVTSEANAFDAVRELRESRQTFDLIVVDPPAFAKSRRETEGGLRGYRDLNRHAMRLLAPGGRLVTCTCSHHVTREKFEDTLRQAAAELPFRLVIRARIGAGSDHPVWLSLPESEYLKVVVLDRVDLGDGRDGTD